MWNYMKVHQKKAKEEGKKGKKAKIKLIWLFSLWADFFEKEFWNDLNQLVDWIADGIHKTVANLHWATKRESNLDLRTDTGSTHHVSLPRWDFLPTENKL